MHVPIILKKGYLAPKILNILILSGTLILEPSIKFKYFQNPNKGTALLEAIQISKSYTSNGNFPISKCIFFFLFDLIEEMTSAKSFSLLGYSADEHFASKHILLFGNTLHC